MTYISKPLGENQFLVTFEDGLKHVVSTVNGTEAEIDELVQYIRDLKAGNIVVPEPQPVLPPLNRVQFFTLLELAFKKTPDDIVALIEAAITDSLQRIAAKNKVLHSHEYHRENELFVLLAPQLNITDEQIDAAWHQALTIV